MLELDPVAPRARGARLGHQCETVGGRRVAGVLDEVRVLRRDHAPPTRWPFRPQSSSICPAPSSPGGFLKTEPNVRFVVGCVALRRSTRSLDLGADLGRVARREPVLDAARRPGRAAAPSAGTRARARPASASRLPSAVATSARTRIAAPVAVVGSGIHPHASAGRARDRAGELEAAEPGSARAMEADRVRRAAARRRESSPVDRDLRELAREPQNEHVDPRRRPRADSSRARPSQPPSPCSRRPAAPARARPVFAARRRHAPGRRCRSSSAARARRPPRSSRRQPVHDRAGDLPRLPDAERDRRRRPGAPTRAQACGVVERRRPARSHVRWQGVDDELPATPSRGASRAPMMSVTIAASASPSAAPSS